MFKSDQPIPSKDRGLYFSGTSYLQLLPTATVLLAPSLTVEAWIRPQGTGVRTIFAKYKDCVSIFALRLRSNGYLEIAETQSSTTDNTGLIENKWVHIAVTVAFNSHFEDTSVSFYQNGVQTSSFQSLYLWDTHLTAPFSIGRNSGGDFYKGFIWSVFLYNSVLSASDIAGKVTPQGCPSGLSFCLSTAAFLQTAEGEACLPACEYGCVRNTDCSLCSERLCSVCEDFETTRASCRATQSCSCLHGGIRIS